MNSEGHSQGLAQGRSQKYVQNGTPDFYLLKQMAQFSLHKNQTNHDKDLKYLVLVFLHVSFQAKTIKT